MGWVVRSREEGMASESDQAATYWRSAAKAKARGDEEEALRLADAASAADCAAIAFADGHYDDVVQDRQGGRR